MSKKANSSTNYATMRIVVDLFLLLVFVVIIASISENRESALAKEKIAMEVNVQNSLAQESTAANNELGK